MIKFREKKYGVYDAMANGSIYEGKGVAGGSGTVAKLARGIAAPVSVAGMVGDQANSAIKGTLNQAAETAKNYTPTVQNAYVQQKNNSAIEAVKQVGTGLGKGLWNLAKKNKGTLGGAAAFGGLMTAGTYGMNRIQRQQAEIAAGEREPGGMSTGGKIVAGTTALGTGALAAHKTGKGFDRNLAKAQKDVAKYEGRVASLQRGIDNINKGKVGPNVGSSAKDVEKLTSYKKEAEELLKSAKKDVNKRTNKFLGSKKFRMGRNALIAGGLIAGAGYMADKMLKSSRRAYSVGGVIYKGAKKVGNFLGLGKNPVSNTFRTIDKSLRESGEYGVKASDFLRKHKKVVAPTAAVATGWVGYDVASRVGEKPVSAIVSRLDKKTDQFAKSQMAMAQQNNYSISGTASTLAKNAKRQAMENPLTATSLSLVGINSAMNIYNSQASKKARERTIEALDKVNPRRNNIIIS